MFMVYEYCIYFGNLHCLKIFIFVYLRSDGREQGKYYTFGNSFAKRSSIRLSGILTQNNEPSINFDWQKKNKKNINQKIWIVCSNHIFQFKRPICTNSSIHIKNKTKREAKPVIDEKLMAWPWSVRTRII